MMFIRRIPFIAGVYIILTLLSCGSPPGRKEGIHFTLLPASGTGITFTNTIKEDEHVNLFANEYAYMGGGVGVGDFNHDGLPDLFFAGNQVSSRLYLNKGDLHFEDVTERAGLVTQSWCTGVSVVDLNNDGWPDLYLCVSGKVPGTGRKNLLYINRRDGTFTEEADAYGLSDTSYSTQAVFFDYDRDGRLDMYLLNHKLAGDGERPNDIHPRGTAAPGGAADKLFHNEGTPPGMDHPVFKDVSAKAGIVEDGYGLGIVVSDLDHDGYPDLYVANDYVGNDLLWMNNRDGTFTNRIASAMRHQSYSSMGTDAADCNNDGLADVITLDMQPETNVRKKSMYSFLSDQRHEMEKRAGYEPEYMRNMLQLNNGLRRVGGKEEPFFSEIGQMAGISETDWSWSVLIADLDNDGWKDIHITNGMGRDPINADFLEYRYALSQQNELSNETPVRKTLMDKLSLLGSVPMYNYIYRNKGDCTMEDVSRQAGITQRSISNGAVYVDLDNDGDLDLVVNNINQEAFVMRNDLVKGDTHFLTLELLGDSLNKGGLGATVYAYNGKNMQMLEQYPVRGYLSTVDSRLHVGVKGTGIDSLRIIWPDGGQQVLERPAMDTILTVAYAPGAKGAVLPATPAPLFSDVSQRLHPEYRHQEKPFFDYAFQPLIPQKYSREGPFFSTGDVNGDGLVDLFVGGAFGQSGRLYLQQKDGHFEGKDLVSGSKQEEDMQSIFFDADGDKDLDLLVISGSSEFDLNSPYYRPRLYINDGKGNFQLDVMAFPVEVHTPGKAVAVADFDGDGDPDIFIGGRVALGQYPMPARSFLLRNDHGRFTDVTEAVCPALERPGLINAAVWADIDNDKIPDLIIAGDWMPVRVFKNTGSVLQEMTDTAVNGLSGLPGFWRSLAVADVDNDGDMDIIAGNAGLNNPYHISVQQPAELLAKDFDGNGIIDPIFCYYIRNEQGAYELCPGLTRDDWAMQVPSIKKRYPGNELFAKAPMREILPDDSREGALVLYCRETRSGWFENLGGRGIPGISAAAVGAFRFHPFPMAAQVAPVNTLVCTDVDGDGRVDLLLAGNEYQMRASAGAADASYGLVLGGDGKGGFTPFSPVSTGLILDGDVRDMKLVRVGGKQLLLVAVNNEKVRVFEINMQGNR